MLYVEQEVKADMTPAIEAVLSADERRLQLLAIGPMLQGALEADSDGTAAFVGATAAVENLISQHGKESPMVAAARSQLPILEEALLRGSQSKKRTGKSMTAEEA